MLKLSNFAPIMGVLLGGAFDMWFKGSVIVNRRQMSYLQDISVAVISIHAKFAKADGAVSPAEIKAFRKWVEISPQDEDAVGIIYDAARKDKRSIEEHLVQLQILSKYQLDAKYQLMESLYYVAEQNNLPKEQLKLLKSAEKILEIPVELSQQFHQEYLAETSSNADDYAVLGLTAQANKSEIRRAYKTLVNRYHPDKLSGEGKTAQEIKQAQQKLTVINAAYNNLMKG